MAVRDVGNLRTRLSFEDKGATSSLQRFKQDLAGLRSEMRTVTAMGKGYTTSLKGLRQQQDILNRTLKTHQERVNELNRRYQEAVRAKGEDSEEARKLNRQYNNARAEMLRTEQQLKRVTSAIEEQQNPWKRLGRNLDQAGDKFKTVGQRMSDFGRSYTMHVTAPIVAGGTAIFKAAMDFESAFAGVQKTVNASEEELQELRKAIREMAKEIPASAEEIAAVAEAAGQLGIETESIEEFTRTMIDLGEATNLTSEQAATEFARFANIVGMSQKDFDRLGSSVVALGNSMATTESEISSMAMRLAAQGSQVGMTEAQIMALAATMSSLGIQAEMGGTAMTTILKKIQSAVGEGGKSLQGFAKVARVSSDEFAKVWSKDPIKALDMFIKGLAKSGEEGENLSGILADLSIKGVYETDVLMRLAGGADLLSNAVNTSTEAWKENTALTDEASQRYQTTESRMRILWNRIKDVAIQLGDSLAPAIMDALEAAEPFIKSIEDGAKAFSEMDKEQQQSILKMIAFVAAAGPATMVLGGIARGIGSILDVGGKVFNLFGKASGGTGLLARIAQLGPLGVGGLAVGGVTLLATGIYTLAKNSEKSTEAVLKNIEAREKEIDAIDETIAKYQDLYRKNKLSNDEMLRLLDIRSQLDSEGSPEVLKDLQAEYDKLLEKSGLTNGEMEDFLKLNDDIVSQTPTATEAISERGNAYAGAADEAQRLNDEQRKLLQQETYTELKNKSDDYIKNLKKQKELINDISSMEKEHTEHLNNKISINDQIREKDLEIAQIKEDLVNLTGEEKFEAEKRLVIAEQELINLRMQLEDEDAKLSKLEDQIKSKQDSLDTTNKEIDAYEVLLDKYAVMALEEQGINAERGKGVETIIQQQKEINKARAELRELLRAGEITTGQYELMNKELDEKQGKIDAAKRKLEEMNIVAGETVYKDINIDTNPTIDQIHSQLSEEVTKHVRIYTTPDTQYARIGDPITKQVNIRTAGGRSLAMYAEGTPPGGHKGGPAIVGELGPELARIGNRWSMLDFGIYDLPRGTHVFTHEESKRILGAINRIPAYANGARPVGEANRIVNELNNQQTNTLIPNQPMVIQLVTPDKRVLAEYVVDEITEMQDFKRRRRERFA